MVLAQCRQQAVLNPSKKKNPLESPTWSETQAEMEKARQMQGPTSQGW